MSIDDNKKYISAYEKMLEDGSAYREVDMTMHSEPDLSVATGNREQATAQPALSENPLGDVVNEDEDRGYSNDYSEFDNSMEKRIASLRNKMQGGGVRKTPRPPKNQNEEIVALKKRVKRLEDALMLVMETHEKLLG